MSVTILDGPVGTELDARGVRTELPLWSAHGLIVAPDVVRAIHRDYAAAGATVHTANTFRTKRRTAGEPWRVLTELAVRLAREAVPAGHRVAGSIAPLEDCYRPDLSPRDAREEHREMASALAGAGVDVMLCETFPHVGEACVAVEEAVATGVPTWAAFTPGPDADLLTPAEVGEGARRAVGLGARAVLVNCVPVTRALDYVRALADAVGSDVPFGCYANSGYADAEVGFASLAVQDGARRYADEAARWVEAGARIAGSCCGTGPAHVAELARRFA